MKSISIHCDSVKDRIEYTAFRQGVDRYFTLFVGFFLNHQDSALLSYMIVSTHCTLLTPNALVLHTSSLTLALVLNQQ